jgi:hypothetical protein
MECIEKGNVAVSFIEYLIGYHKKLKAQKSFNTELQLIDIQLPNGFPVLLL